MTREQAKKNLEIIKAFAEGKTVQFRNKEFPQWTDFDDPQFDSTCGEYRIKPEPRTWWVAVDGSWIAGFFDSRPEALSYAEGYGEKCSVIQVREVL